MRKVKKLLVMLLCVILLAGSLLPVNALTADDSVTCINLGTNAPSASLLSEYGFRSDENNGLAENDNVTSIPMLYSSISSSTAVSVYKVPSSWTTWSNGFTGKVYSTDNYNCTLTMPNNCLGVILYVEPMNFGIFNFTVSAGGMSTNITQAVDGSYGAKGFAFVSNDQYITTITISTVSATGGFAFGELYTSYGAIVNCSDTAASKDSKILAAFSDVLGVNTSRLSYQISTPSGKTQTYPDGGMYDVTVTVDSTTSYTFPGGLIVLKGSQSAPSAPALSATSNTITVTPTTGCEYSLNGTTWQDSNVFTGLNNVTNYTVYMRYKETGTLSASPSSSASITTDKGSQDAPPAPVLSSTATTVTAQSVSDCEYSLNGTTWQDSNVFTGLNNVSNYTVYMRYKGTTTLYASPCSSASVITDKGSQDAPPVPVLSCTETTVVANNVTGCEYSLNGETWQDSNMFFMLHTATEYTVYMRYKGTTTLYASPYSTATITTDKGGQSMPSAPVLSSTATTVTVQSVTGCEYSLDNATWQDSNVFSGLDMVTEYTVYMRYKETDTLYVSQPSSATITTDKGSQETPSAPVLSSTATTVTAQSVTGCEYSLDGTIWQNSNVFSSLGMATEYTVYMRYKGTDTLYASLPSSAAVTTDKGTQAAPSAPVLSSTATTVTAQSATGCEYSLDGTIWQDSNVFSGLDMVTEYTVYMRYKGTDTLYASPSSSASITTDKGTQVAPSTPALSKTATSVTAQPITGCEYSLDNATWQDSNVFSALDMATEYTVYMRYKGTDTLYASPSSSASITTDKGTQIAPSAPVLTSTSTSVTAQSVTGCEYSLDNTTWQDSNVFSGLKAGTQYTVYMRYKATDKLQASPASSTTIKSVAVPPTGDTNAPVLYAMLMLFSVCAAMFVCMTQRKKLRRSDVK